MGKAKRNIEQALDSGPLKDLNLGQARRGFDKTFLGGITEDLDKSIDEAFDPTEDEDKVTPEEKKKRGTGARPDDIILGKGASTSRRSGKRALFAPKG